jgi:hypothetical protein
LGFFFSFARIPQFKSFADGENDERNFRLTRTRMSNAASVPSRSLLPCCVCDADTGRVSSVRHVVTRLTRNDRGEIQTLRLAWREVNGGRVCESDHSGFGSRLIAQSLNELGGSTRVHDQVDSIVREVEVSCA